MKWLFWGNSFKQKLMVAFGVIGLVPLIITSSIYQNILSSRIIKDSQVASIEKLRYLSFNMERQIAATQQLLGWLTYNRRIEQILVKNYNNMYEKQLDIFEFSSYVTEYMANSHVESNIYKILIIDEDGYSFQMGNGYSLLNQEAIEALGWLERYQSRSAQELVMSKDIYRKDTYVFPMSARIYDNLSGEPIGWCLIVFQNNLYSDYLLAAANDSSRETLFMINKEGQCIANMNQKLLGKDMSEEPLVKDILSSGQQTGHVTGMYEDRASILHYYRIPNTNMIEILGTSLDVFLHEKQKVTTLFILAVMVTGVSILFAILYLGNKLMQPIHIISDYIKHVPESGFKGNMILESDDEFKTIAVSINAMEGEIRQLLEEQRREAEVKKALEFQVLQNQINPHFLYNTLNSIKWMATLQHADTIRDMTAALGRLLQNISKGEEHKIPVYEEMSLLDDYILIQDIRYNGKIQVEYHIGNREITQAYIIKFLLQPIVENAMFHGIEPNGGCGTIHIYLDLEREDLLIRILDDGIGMTQEQMQKLLSPKHEEKNVRGLSGVGIRNIHQRIIMTYGKQYGITIASQLGEETQVTIRIPYEKEGC